MVVTVADKEVRIETVGSCLVMESNFVIKKLLVVVL